MSPEPDFVNDKPKPNEKQISYWPLGLRLSRGERKVAIRNASPKRAKVAVSFIVWLDTGVISKCATNAIDEKIAEANRKRNTKYKGAIVVNPNKNFAEHEV
jgi:hypothetical protein